MAINPFSLSHSALHALSGDEHHLDDNYPNNSESSRSDGIHTSLSIHHPNDNLDNAFFPDLQDTHSSLFNSYGEIDWSMYGYHNPFSLSPTPALDHDSMSNLGTVDEPLSPASDTTAVGPSTMPSDFKLPSPYDVDEAYNTSSFGPTFDPNAATPVASGLSSPDPSALYDPFFGYGHQSQFVLGAATDASSPPQHAQCVGVDVSAGEVPLTFTYPQTLVIADQEDPPAAPQAQAAMTQAEGKARQASDAPRRSTRCRQVPVNAVVDVANEDESDDHDAERVKRGKPERGKSEYRCTYCPSVFDRSYNRNAHVAAVHERKKDHVCPHTKCAQGFARKHDLVRHIQSFHTDLGSPRRHPPTSGEQKAPGKRKN